MSKSTIQREIRELLEKTNRPRELVAGLHKILRSHADKQASSTYRELVPEMRRAFGTPKPVLVVIANELGKYGQRSPKPMLSLLDALWENGSYEERDIVGKTVEKLAQKYPDECLNLVRSFLPDLDNWSVCDVLAGMGMRPIVISRTKEALLLCKKCVSDSNKWIRRFGVVTLWTFKKIPAPPEVFEILTEVMTDQDRDVKRGAAWILRQIVRKNPDEVAEFLVKWARAQPNRHARWIIRNGMKELPKERQNQILSIPRA